MCPSVVNRSKVIQLLKGFTLEGTVSSSSDKFPTIHVNIWMLSLMNQISLLLKDDQRSSHYSFCATGLSLWVDWLQYLRSTPQELTHYTTLTSVYGSVNTLSLNKMPFSFSFSILKLYFIF